MWCFVFIWTKDPLLSLDPSLLLYGMDIDVNILHTASGSEVLRWTDADFSIKMHSSRVNVDFIITFSCLNKTEGRCRG